MNLGRKPTRLEIARLGYLLIVLIFLVVRGLAFSWSPIRRLPDTRWFEELDLLARGYHRFPTVPLLYRVVGSDHFRTVAQFTLAAVCWSILAAVIAATMRTSRLRVWAFAAILLFGSSVQIVVWDRNLLAESVGFSLAAAAMASWILLLARPSVGSATAVCVSMLFFSFVRETFAALTMLLVPVLLISLVFRQARRYRVAVLVVLLLISTASLAILLRKDVRWQFAMENVITKRILTDPERLATFRDAGMPVTPQLMALAGGWASSDGWRLHQSEEFRGFRQWLVSDFPRAYRKYLLEHPKWTLLAPLKDRESLLSPAPFYCYEGQVSILPLWLTGIVYPDSPFFLLACLCAVTAFAIFVFARPGAPRTWIVPIALLASTPIHALIVWHGDAMEVGRHAVALAGNLRLAILVLLLFAADAFASKAPNQSVETGGSR